MATILRHNRFDHLASEDRDDPVYLHRDSISVHDSIHLPLPSKAAQASGSRSEYDTMILLLLEQSYEVKGSMCPFRLAIMLNISRAAAILGTNVLFFLT